MFQNDTKNWICVFRSIFRSIYGGPKSVSKHQKSEKMKIFKKKSFEISALFGPIQFFSAQLFYNQKVN